MNIQDLFVTAKPMPKELFVTANTATIVLYKGVKKPKPAPFDWDITRRISNPEELMLPEWLEWDNWNIGDKVACICPAKIDGSRRLKTNNPQVSLLGLDFDSPSAIKLDDLKKALSKFAGFWYTTRNHGKEKHGVTCDRYRVFLAYSRPVSHVENHLIHNMLAIDLGHDSQCGDATRVFNPSVKGCQYGTLGGTLAVDANYLIAIANSRGITASNPLTGQQAALCAAVMSQAHGIDWSTGKVDKTLKRSLSCLWTSKYKTDCENQTFNTRSAVLALMFKSFERTSNLADIAATLEDCVWFEEWANRKGEDYRASLVWAYAQTVAEQAEEVAAFEPIMPITPIDYSKLPPIPQEYKNLLEGFRKSVGCIGTPEKDKTHQALLFAVQGQSILSIPCGLEKSVGASVFAAYRFKTHPVWLVHNSHKAVKDTLKRLSVLGVPESDIGYIAGFGDKVCTNQKVIQAVTDKRLSAKNIYNPKTTPCKACADAGKCPFAKYHFHFEREIKKPILVMTHRMFLIKFQPWKLTAIMEYGVNPETVVIFDEQVTRWETGTYTRSDIESALNLAGLRSGACAATLAAIDAACLASGEMFDSKKTVSGVGVIAQSEGVDNRGLALKSLSAHKLTDDEHLKDVDIVTLLCTRAKRYVIRHGDKFSILADRQQWDMPPKCVMLDGSARYTQVVWDGFTMYDGGTATTKGLHINIVKGNATKSSLTGERGDDFRAYYESIIADKKPSKVVYAVNKDDKTFVAPNPTDLLARRGTDTRGSNDFLTADCMIVVMALFTDATDYALRAALATGGQIEVGAVWKKTPLGIVPNLDKKGFTDKRMQLAFVRQAVDECYQAIMRIGVRRYDGGKYHVVCRLPNALCVAELKGRLPGVTIEEIGFKVKPSRKSHMTEQARFENASSVALSALAQKLEDYLKNRVA